MKANGKFGPRRPIKRVADDTLAGDSKARVESAKDEVEAMILGTKPVTET